MAAVRTGTGGFVYIDGAAAGSGSGTSVALAPLAVAIGYDFRDNTNRFTGLMDDIRIYSRALSASEIDGLHEALVPNQPPAFAADPFRKPSAVEDSAYSGSIAGNAADPDAGDGLTFSKVSGPAWLSVAPNGTLSGTPGNSNVGANSFTVRVSDPWGLSDDATLNITITCE